MRFLFNKDYYIKFLFRIKTQKVLKMDKNLENCRILEINQFKSLFSNLTISLKDMEEMDEEIRVIDILNHYRFKTLPKTIQNRCKTAKITDFGVVKGKETDMRFITFNFDNKTVELISKYFQSSDRTFRKYKVEFSKAERSLLWKLKNTEKLLPDHRNEVDTREAIDLNSIIRELPEYEEFKNEKQHKPTEYEVGMEIKRRKAREHSEKQKLTILHNRWRLLGMPEIKPSVKEVKIKPDTEFLKNSVEVKQGALVFNGLGEFKRAG